MFAGGSLGGLSSPWSTWQWTHLGMPFPLSGFLPDGLNVQQVKLCDI